ncbi:MAG: cob(I)yrinic acid a,c-diamide adenosyltransferase [Planctomycetes bacterium]|nr:cob(I)yrinic acid a,c-diamide adenosyltransferase [Planctomycetota bacterium]
MSLHTRTGDTGETSLIDGSRVAKDDVRVCAYGNVDELNSVLGWCRAACRGEIAQNIIEIQSRLFHICSELATPPTAGGKWEHLAITRDHCLRLESWIDEATATVGPINHFVLPGGAEAACRLHMARVCCRRAERGIVALHHISPVRAELMIYLNRLSDLLYAWTRLSNRQAGCSEIPWRPNA